MESFAWSEGVGVCLGGVAGPVCFDRVIVCPHLGCRRLEITQKVDSSHREGRSQVVREIGEAVTVTRER